MGRKKLTDEERKQRKKEYLAKWRAEHKDEIAEYNAKWRAEHPDYDAKYAANHKEKIAEYQAEYRAENPEYQAKWREENPEYKAKYYQEHKEEIAEYEAEYNKTPMGRAVYLVRNYRQNDIKYNRGECTLTAQWVVDNIFNKPCHYCGETDWLKIGCDRIDNSLPHTPDNVVPCCAECNRKRGTIGYEEFKNEKDKL